MGPLETVKSSGSVPLRSLFACSHAEAEGEAETPQLRAPEPSKHVAVPNCAPQGATVALHELSMSGSWVVLMGS